jgi:hypothetical protein
MVLLTPIRKSKRRHHPGYSMWKMENPVLERRIPDPLKVTR